MAERHYRLKCLGRDVTMIVDDEKGVAFDGYDERAERSLKAFGKSGSSPCWIVAHAVVEGTLVEDLFRYTRAGKDAEAVYALAASAGVNITDRHGYTPLHSAARRGRTDAVKALLRHEDILVNAVDRHGYTPLHLAARRGRTDTVKALLRHEDILVNAVDRDDYTPLHWAALWGHTDTVKALLRHEDINVNAVNKDGKTPLEVAAHEGHTKIVQLIEDWLEKHHDA